jgi:hypothetical protein
MRRPSSKSVPRQKNPTPVSAPDFKTCLRAGNQALVSQPTHYRPETLLDPDSVSERQEYFVFWLYNTGQFRTSRECYGNGSAIEVMLGATHPQRLGRCWLETQLEPESTAGSRGRLTSPNDDLGLEVLSFGLSVGERKVATFEVLDIVRRLPLLLAVAVLVGVVLRRDDDTSLVGRKVRNDITPTLVYNMA